MPPSLAPASRTGCAMLRRATLSALLLTPMACSGGTSVGWDPNANPSGPVLGGDGGAVVGNTTGSGNNGSSANGGSTTASSGASTGSSSAGSGLNGCQPPDVLFVLDRTMSMHRQSDGRPAENTQAGRQLSKWYLAIDAIESLVSELDDTIRFGLELFPRDPAKNDCITLVERIQGVVASNPKCEAGEVLVSPELGTFEDIDTVLEPEDTLLCRSTPIGAGLGTAREELATLADPVRDRFAVLITDGQDTCDESLSLANGQGIAADGAQLFVIGFDGSGRGVDNGHLNDLACAGRTAKGFPDTCMKDTEGNFIAADRDGKPLYILAEDQAQLSAELQGVAGQVCCGCII